LWQIGCHVKYSTNKVCVLRWGIISYCLSRWKSLQKARHPAFTAEAPAFRHGEYVTITVLKLGITPKKFFLNHRDHRLDFIHLLDFLLPVVKADRLRVNEVPTKTKPTEGAVKNYKGSN